MEKSEITTFERSHFADDRYEVHCLGVKDSSGLEITFKVNKDDVHFDYPNEGWLSVKVKLPSYSISHQVLFNGRDGSCPFGSGIRLVSKMVKHGFEPAKKLTVRFYAEFSRSRIVGIANSGLSIFTIPLESNNFVDGIVEAEDLAHKGGHLFSGYQMTAIYARSGE